MPKDDKRPKNSSLADQLFPKDIEDFTDSILSIPPEQRRLHTETYDYSIATLVDYLRSNHIFVPHFQRGYVWTDSQASRLIESLIIQCPLPVIYLSQESDERLSVIDGNQRLQSILRYVEGQFDLRGLTAYPELTGLRYSELDPRFQRHILNRTLRCIVIMKDTHPQVKFDVFERLNTGAVKLSPQELRHGIYHGKFIDWIDEASRDKKWRELIRVRIDKRMKAEEFMLRFLSMHFSIEQYEKPLAGFLNKFAEDNREPSKERISEFEQIVSHTVSGVERVFGEFAFKVFDRNEKNKVLSDFNAAVFDAQMLSVSRSPADLSKATPRTCKAILDAFGQLFHNEEFMRSITLATSDTLQIRTRIRLAQEVISTHS